MQILSLAGLLLFLLITTERLLFAPLHWLAAIHLPHGWVWVVSALLVAWLIGDR